MHTILTNSPIHPYGHRSLSEKPASSPSDSTLLDPSHIEIFTAELKSLISAMHPAPAPPIQHYFLSVPMYFSPHSESLIHAALKTNNLPSPISTVTADSAAFLALKRGNCQHFVSCAPVDFEKHILLFLEYSTSTMSASFLNFWGGWFLTPHAYLADLSLGAEHEGEEGHWERITERVSALIEDYEHKLFEGPEDKRRFTVDALRISFLGERGGDERFRGAVEDALKPFAGEKGLKGLRRFEEVKVLDPVYLTAMGVAREAKDRIDKRGIMAGCNSETAACTKVRELVVKDTLVGKKEYKGYERWRDEL